jgi:general secretion pathway protein D
MLSLLDGFAVPEGTIRAAASDDMLLVKGTAGDRAAPADLAATGGGDVRFTANDGDNTIIIRAPEPIRRQAMALLSSLDRAPVQVLIDVMLVEVTLDDATRLGVQAFLQGANGSATVSNGTTGDIAGSYPGFNLVLGAGQSPKVIIDSLSQVTRVKVVSAPSVVAFENEEAEIKVVEQVPIVTQQVTSTTTPDAPTVNSVEYKDAGVILRVTPQVSQSNLVNLQVNQELSAVVTDSSGKTTLTPTLRQRSITTRVAVYDRQTVVLGGLISQQNTQGKGALFGLIPTSIDGANARTELVVFITPHVVRNLQDAASVSAELRAKMGMMTAP